MLIVNHVAHEDGDEYTCRATNIAGTRSTRGQLNIRCLFFIFLFFYPNHINPILAKPRLYVPPKYQYGYEVEKGKTIELRIPFKAHPQATAKWTKDGEPLVIGGRVQLEMQDRY